MRLVEQVEHIYGLLTDKRLEDLGLLSFKGGKLATPLTGDVQVLLTHRSKRADEFIAQSKLKQLIEAIKARKAFKGINHIGFCYKVDSKKDEVKRLTKEAKRKGHHVYQEPSIDDADWLFVGDISEINNPLLEFLPIEGQPNDKWVDYWLPHIQFDIDTSLSPKEIKVIVQKVINRPFTPYPIEIDGVTYIQRVNIGCVEGVNLMLDISTNNRDINYRKSWSKLV